MSVSFPPWVDRLLVGGLVAFLLAQTIAPTIHSFVDSAEYAIGAHTLGIVHAPGYPLYLLVAHLFTRLPFGDVAFRVNLFSAVSLTLAVVFTHGMLLTLLRDRWAAAAAALSVALSLFVWQVGVAAEVYAPQLMLLALTGWLLAAMRRHTAQQERLAMAVGVTYGLAVAMNPSSALLGPGVALAFVLMRVTWRRCVLAGVLAIVIFLLSLSYFPLRHAADPVFNVAGFYNADGVFQQANLQTLAGIYWLVSGTPFRHFMFQEGALPAVTDVWNMAQLLWFNFIGLGVLVGVVGLWRLSQERRGLLAVWVVSYLPYIYFFSTYAVADKDTMLSPSYLVWTVALGYGLHWLTDSMANRWRALVAMALPALMLWTNYPLADASDLYDVREQAQTIMEDLPPDTVVFGRWVDVIALEYLQIVEGQRPDVELYNMFYYAPNAFEAHFEQLVTDTAQPLVLLPDAFNGDELARDLSRNYTITVVLPEGGDQDVYYLQLRREALDANP